MGAFATDYRHRVDAAMELVVRRRTRRQLQSRMSCLEALKALDDILSNALPAQLAAGHVNPRGEHVEHVEGEPRRIGCAVAVLELLGCERQIYRQLSFLLVDDSSYHRLLDDLGSRSLRAVQSLQVGSIVREVAHDRRSILDVIATIRLVSKVQQSLL